MNKKIALLLLLTTPLAAQDARGVIEEVQRRGSSTSQFYEGWLQVTDARGRTAEKRWTYVRTGSHGRSKSVLRFTAPAEVKGVALLIANSPDRASDQWMWRPAIARDQRIALQDRSTRFFGTDFTFEDLEERDVDQFDFRLLGEEPLDGAACWKIESRPRKAKSSQYSYSVLWVRKDTHTYARADNYVGDKLVRRLLYLDLAKTQDIWTAMRMEMTDLGRKSRTVLKLEKLKYNAPVKDDDFTPQALRREL